MNAETEKAYRRWMTLANKEPKLGVIHIDDLNREHNRIRKAKEKYERLLLASKEK